MLLVVGNIHFSTRNLRLLLVLFVGFGYAVALCGSFEQALQNPSNGGSPIFSSLYGAPFLHHYLTGFLILAVGLVILLIFSPENK